MMHDFDGNHQIPCRNKFRTMNCRHQACHQLFHADSTYMHHNMLDSHHDDNAVVLHVDMQVLHATSVDVAIKYGMCSIHV